MGETNGGTALVQRADETARQVSPFAGDAEAWKTAQRVAMALSSSSVVPEAYRGEQGLANTLVAMEYANRLGASVLAVMQNLDVIHGRPSLRSTFLIGTVNACGRFSPIRYRWQGTEGKDDWGCRAVAKDRETGEECIGPLITIALSKAEGWYGKGGSKWKTIPELMLMYRAGAWWSRVYCPELSLGLHTSDEVEDLGAAPATRIQGAAAALDAGDPGGEPFDASPASPEQIKQLEQLRVKAREGEFLQADDEEAIEESIAAKDGTRVRGWIRELQILMARGQEALPV